jgi:recombination protein RecA
MAKNIEEAIKELIRQFGEGVIIKLDDKPRRDIQAISTGSLTVDHALGIGGIPIGRVTELYGFEGSGKSTIGLHIVAEAQKQFLDAPAVYIDMEHGLDTTYAEAIGVNTKELLISQPQSGVAALTIVKKMIGLASVIIVDSVPALVTQAELDAAPGDSHVGILPRLMSQHLKEIVPKLGLSNTALVFINQVRMTIGGYGNPEVSPGGLALKFYASVRMNVRRNGWVGLSNNRTGQTVEVKAVKNKCAPPFRTAEATIIFGKGISRHIDVLTLAVKQEIIEKKGSYYYYEDENIAHGQQNAEAWVAQHPEIEKAVREKLSDVGPILDTDSAEPERIDTEVLDLFGSLTD